MNDITIVIKTFLRVNCLERLLKSIRRYAYTYPIIICDDSKDAQYNKEYIMDKFNDLNINYIITEFDIGVSKGRNILINNVKTKYFVLCDDDFIFTKQTNLLHMKEQLEKEQLDILGGTCLYAIRVEHKQKITIFQHAIRLFQKILGIYRKISYRGDIISVDSTKIKINLYKIDYKKGNLYKTDICDNFFLAKTSKIKEIMWNEKLKVSEHEDLFIRAKEHGTKVAISTDVSILHYPETNIQFKIKRMKSYYNEVLKSHNIKELEIIRNNVGIIQRYLLIDDEVVEKTEYTGDTLGKRKKCMYTLLKQFNKEREENEYV